MPYIHTGIYTGKRRLGVWYMVCSYCEDYTPNPKGSRKSCLSNATKNGWEAYRFYSGERIACPKCRPTCERE